MTLFNALTVAALTAKEQEDLTKFIGTVLIIAAVFLVVAILLQTSKEKGMSSALGGASSSDTYYGKNKGNSRDYILNKLTIVVAIIFALLVLISFVIQKEESFRVGLDDFKGEGQTTVTTTAGSTTDAGTTTEGATTTPATTTGADTTTAAE